MSNIFSGMNRKQKREFDKLDKDKKSEFIQAAILDKLSPIMAQETAKSMIAGMELEREQIYQKYVTKIDESQYDEEQWCNGVDELLSFLRMEHLKYQQKQMRNMEDKQKNEV